MLSFQTSKFRLSLDSSAKVVSLFNLTLGKEYLSFGKTIPLLSLYPDSQRKIDPTCLFYDKGRSILTIGYGDGSVKAFVEVRIKPTHICFQLKKIEGIKPTRIDWGPFPTVIGKIIGETVGVVRDEETAIGIQSLNIQTIAGAMPTEFGSQLFAYAIEEEGGISGSAIALFLSQAKDALKTIGEIEVEEGLPHPMLDGVWAKVSPSATLSYLITDFSEANIDEALLLCRKLGFKYIYHPGPFETWGHFILDKNRFPEGDESLKRCVEKAKKLGIRVGLHTLTAFITPNDPYVSPRPDPRLGGLGASQLSDDIDEASKEIPVAHKEPFIKKQNWGFSERFVLIDEEIIKYDEVSGDNPPKLIGCVRGVFGTRISNHKKGTEVRRLATHAYGTFYPGIRNGMMDEMAKRLVELFNYCGLQQISFDGLEGLWDYEYSSPYAANRFVKICYDGWKQEVINDASGLLHFLWHIHTRMNWGEPWGKPMREGMAEYRLKNQDYFSRNLFPHMMGWFEFRSASPQLEATTLDEIEWMLSKCAGWDAGFALVASPEVFKTNGQGEAVINAIREWEEARHLGAFTQSQKERLKELTSEWHLEKVGEKRWLLFPLAFSPKFVFSAEHNKAEWRFNNEFEKQPLRFVMRVLPDKPERTVANPSFKIGRNEIIFQVELKSNQYLVYEGGDEGVVYDWNWHPLQKVKVKGRQLVVPSGEVLVKFSCQFDGERSPSLWIRFKTIGEAEEVSVEK